MGTLVGMMAEMDAQTELFKATCTYAVITNVAVTHLLLRGAPKAVQNHNLHSPKSLIKA